MFPEIMKKIVLREFKKKKKREREKEYKKKMSYNEIVQI